MHVGHTRFKRKASAQERWEGGRAAEGASVSVRACQCLWRVEDSHAQFSCKKVAPLNHAPSVKFILTRHASTVNCAGPAVMAAYRAVRRVVARLVAAARSAAMLLANGGDPSRFGQQELVNYLMSALRNIQVSNFTGRAQLSIYCCCCGCVLQAYFYCV